MNLFQSINSAMDVALQADPSAGTIHLQIHVQLLSSTEIRKHAEKLSDQVR